MRPSTVFALTRQAARLWRTMLAAAPDQAAGRLERVDAIYDGFRPAFAHVGAMAPVALAEAIARGTPPVLVDVRGAHERRVSTLAGAIPADVFIGDPRAYDGRVVVAFCTLGIRSGAWAAERAADGLVVHNLAGGLLAWTHAGGALVTPDGEATRRLHVSGARWNLVAEGYEAVW